jgi:hypothetical protein
MTDVQKDVGVQRWWQDDITRPILQSRRCPAAVPMVIRRALLDSRSMAVTPERTPTPREPVCAICHMPIRAEQDRVTVQEEHCHARCCERREARRPRARAAARARRFPPSAGLSFGWAPTTLDQEGRAP